jgi:hypothetical protein
MTIGARLTCPLRGHDWLRVRAGTWPPPAHTAYRCDRCGRVCRTFEGTHW